MKRITTLINGDLHYLNCNQSYERDMGFEELCWRAGVNPARCLKAVVIKNGKEYELFEDDLVAMEPNLIFKVDWK